MSYGADILHMYRRSAAFLQTCNVEAGGLISVLFCGGPGMKIDFSREKLK